MFHSFSAYHHHFGRQCRVADYGFTKLIELFETIPTTIEITEDADGERILQLTDAERLVVVSLLYSLGMHFSRFLIPREEILHGYLGLWGSILGQKF